MCKQQDSSETSADVLSGAKALDRIVAQRPKGKYTARERLDLLLDQNSFLEVDSYVATLSTDLRAAQSEPAPEAAVVACGNLDGRWVGICADDATVVHGTVSESLTVRTGYFHQVMTRRQLLCGWISPVEHRTHTTRSHETATTGYGNEIVQPAKTRPRLAATLEVLEDKQTKCFAP